MKCKSEKKDIKEDKNVRSFLVFNLIISIAIMIALILVPKFNPALSLVIASIYMGVTCGLGFVNSIETIGTGFGNMMAGIGLPIGFGVILGQLMSDTGAAKVIARTIVHAVPNKYVFICSGICRLCVSNSSFSLMSHLLF